MATLTIVPFKILSSGNKSSRQNKHLKLLKKRGPGAFFYSWRNKLWPIKDMLQASHNIFFCKLIKYAFDAYLLKIHAR
jgi:hypothetical protein